MTRKELQIEVLETAIWLLNIVGMLLIVAGTFFLKSTALLYTGGLFCAAYYLIEALRQPSAKNRKRLYMAISVALTGMIIVHWLIHRP